MISQVERLISRIHKSQSFEDANLVLIFVQIKNSIRPLTIDYDILDGSRLSISIP